MILFKYLISFSFLKLTVDSPSMHPAGFMPILDIQVRTEDDKIIHKFYKKEVSNSRVILNNSAMPMKVKRITCVQEAQEHPERHGLVREERHPVGISMDTQSSSDMTSFSVELKATRPIALPQTQLRLPCTETDIGTDPAGDKRSCWARQPGIDQQTLLPSSPPPQGENWPVGSRRWWTKKGNA